MKAKCTKDILLSITQVDHSRVPLSLSLSKRVTGKCFVTVISSTFNMQEIQYTYTKPSHLDSLWNRGWRELKNGLLGKHELLDNFLYRDISSLEKNKLRSLKLHTATFPLTPSPRCFKSSCPFFNRGKNISLQIGGSVKPCKLIISVCTFSKVAWMSF